jgi:hypothetical protein
MRTVMYMQTTETAGTEGAKCEVRSVKCDD